MVRYWLSTVAALAVLLFATTGYIPFAKPKPPEVNVDSIEKAVKIWSENLGLAFTKGNVPDTYFFYTITTRTGTPITVSRMTKEMPIYLQFQANLTFSPEHQAILGTLNKDQLDTVTQEITLELAKTRVGSAIATMGIPPAAGTNMIGQTVIALQKAAPISGLSEDKFAACVDDMEFTVALARAAVNLALRHATAGRTISKPITR
jgi:hypothetical protein